MRLRNKKTGEVREWQRVGVIDYGELNEVYDSAEYDSIAELNEYWEDYKPAEPLIKDEKVRKAVRAWAEVDALVYVEVETDYRLESVNDDAVIRFDEPVFNGLPKGRNLTITELCGEEEE